VDSGFESESDAGERANKLESDFLNVYDLTVFSVNDVERRRKIFEVQKIWKKRMNYGDVLCGDL
jgi:hypothetical protein